MINDDAVFINGNSGDFISGGHININMKDNSKIEIIKLRKENILSQLIEKHFSLWGYLKLIFNKDNLKVNLWNEIVEGCTDIQKTLMITSYMNIPSLLIDKVNIQYLVKECTNIMDTIGDCHYGMMNIYYFGKKYL